MAGTAHLFQQRIDKTSDVRVTVIGDQVFCVRIDSDLLDWRTDYAGQTKKAFMLAKSSDSQQDLNAPIAVAARDELCEEP